MPELEERVSALETRMDELARNVRHATDLGLTAGREALTAREAHQKNIELLNALRTTQSEQGRTLSEHGRILNEHTRMLNEHTRVLNDHTRVLNDHTARFDAIDGTLGTLTVGMHTIESLLRRLTKDG